MRHIKRLQNLVALFSLCAIASTAPSASFDCGKASTAMEKRICDTPRISRLDGEMGRLYEELLGELAPCGKGALREEQRGWVGTRDARCGSAASGPASAFADCAEPLYERRINRLRAELGKPHQANYPHDAGHKVCGGCEYSGPDAAMGCAGYTTRSGCVSAKHCAWVVKRCSE